MYLGRIESILNSQPNRDKANGEITAHELAHQWKVNPQPPYPVGGHCDKDMYNAAQLKCSMNSEVDTTSQYHDGIVEFHYTGSDASVDSEYITIRRKAEPVPQQP